MRACTEQFCDNAVSMLQGEIANAINYKVEVEENGVSWTVTRKQIESDASRTVCFIDNKLECKCLKAIQNGWACQHITATLLFFGHVSVSAVVF